MLDRGEWDLIVCAHRGYIAAMYRRDIAPVSLSSEIYMQRQFSTTSFIEVVLFPALISSSWPTPKPGK